MEVMQGVKFKYKTAMLVDDNAIDNLVNRKMLQIGYFAENIIVMQSAGTALNYLCNGDPANKIPEVIFLDIQMPEMNGFQFLESFKLLTPDIRGKCKIYMLSSSLDPIDLKRAEENPFVQRFLSKPLRPDMIDEIKLD